MGATLQLTVRTPVQMPHVLQAVQQGPSVAFFPCACGTAHGVPCTARVPGSRVGKKALAQGAQRTQQRWSGRNSENGGRRRARGAGPRVEDTVRTLVKVARVAPRATQLGLGASSSFFRAAEWTRSAVHGRTLPGARTGGVEEGGGGEAGTTIQHTVRPPSVFAYHH